MCFLQYQHRPQQNTQAFAPQQVRQYQPQPQVSKSCEKVCSNGFFGKIENVILKVKSFEGKNIQRSSKTI